MKRILFFLFFVLPAYLAIGQPLSGTYSIPNDYPTIADAITALNTNGVDVGGVIFNVETDHTETTSSQLTITATGTSSNPIVFQRDGAGANPVISRTDLGINTTSTLGGLGDAVIRLDGTDYITFDGIDVASTQQVIEYGYLTHKPNATNGCQNVTIKNCNITMTKGTSAYVMGVYIGNGASAVNAATGVTVTANSGRNENITITGNTISNVHAGIYIRGATANYDQNIVIGQNGAGNVINNFGGGSNTSTYGVYFIYVNNAKADYNIIDNAANGGSAHGSTLYGVFFSTCTGDFTGDNNSITLANTSASSATQYLYNANAGTSHSYSNNSFGASNITSTGTIYLIYNSVTTAATKTVTGNNIIGTFNRSAASGSLYCFYDNGSPTGIFNASGNNFSNINLAGTSVFYGIQSTTSANHTQNIYNNTISNITGGTGLIYPIYLSLANKREVYGNTIHTINGGGTIYGIYVTSGGATLNNFYQNKIYSLSSSTTSTTAGIVSGMLFSGLGANTNIYNNFISDLNAPSSASLDAVRGLSFTSTTVSTNVNVYYNTVYLAASSSGANFGSSGLYHTYNATPTTAVLDMRNNIVVNNSTPNGTGLTVAFRRSASTNLGNVALTCNNNDLFAGTPGASNLIFYDGTTPYQNFADYQSLVTPRDAVSFSSLPPFVDISTTPYDLHIQAGVSTKCESGGAIISTPNIIADFDGDARFPNTGYPNDPSNPATSTDVGADEFAGIPSFTCATPAPGNTLSSANGLCLGQSITMTLENATSGTGVSYQWQSSSDGSSYSDIIGETSSFYSLNPTSELYYQCIVTCQNGPASATSAPIQITFATNITSTTPASRCGTGTVDLSALGTGSAIKWYNAASGGTSIGTGSPFTTPVINSTTSFYAASENYIPGYVKIGTGTSTSTTYSPFLGTDGGLKYQYLYTAAELTAAGIVAGNISNISFHTTTTTSYTYNEFYIDLGTTTLAEFSTPVDIQGGLSQVYYNSSYSTVLGVNNFIFDTPFIWDGVSNIIISTSWSNNNASNTSTSANYNSTTNYSSQHYREDNKTGSDIHDFTGVSLGTGVFNRYTNRPHITFGANVPCSSIRIEVVATVTPPPALTITANQAVCNNAVATLDVTSTIGDYDTYIWSPVANLYIDMACTLPYTGSNETTVYAKTATEGTTTYTCSASNASLCANVVTTDVLVLPVPSLSASPATLCVSGSSVITATPSTGYSTATFQWQDSPDDITYTDISSANALSYTTATITNSTYYKLQVKLGSNVCSETSTEIVVNNPMVASATPDSRCGTGTLTLGATASSGTLNWYAAASGGTSLGTGSTYTTPSLSTTTSYYVGAGFGSTIYGARTAPAGTGTYTSSAGLVFDAYQAFVLQSVDVYATAAGNVVVKLYNSSGTELLTTTVAVTAAGAAVAQSITLNFNIPIGTGYRLMTSSNPALVRESSLGGFPYSLGVNGSVTGGWLSSASTSYYYFYNWKMSDLCESPRQEVVATVIPASVGGNVNGDQNICSNILPSDLTLSGNVGDVLKWQKSADLAFSLPVDITNTTTTLSGAEIGLLSSNTYFRALVQSGSCTDAYSSIATITVNPALTASVSISTPLTTVNDGTTVTFTATPTNGGTTPVYQWYVNANSVGTNANTFTYAPANNDEVTCQLTSDIANCISNNPAMSNAINMTVNSIGAITRTWSGTANESWTNPTNWANGIPTAIDNIVIPAIAIHFPTITAPVTINKLTVESNASGTGSLLDNGNLTITGTATVKNYVEGEKWHLISSPVQNVLSNVFDLPSGQADIYVRQFNGGVWTYITNLTTPIVTGKGYGIWADTQTNSTPHPTVPFVGSLNTGVQLLPTTGASAWDLLGNPYVSAINWNTVNTANVAGGAVRVWNQALTLYSAYSSLGGSVNGGNQFLAPMQGFFVQTTDANGISLDNTNRVHNGQLFLKSTNTISDLVKITAQRGSYKDEINVVMNPIATNNYDVQYDASKLFANDNNIPEIYTTSGNHNLVINIFKNAPIAIPMNIRLGVSDNVTLTASEFANFDANVSIKLEDLLLGTTQDLRLNPSYTFAASIGDNANRFILHFATATGINENNGGNTSIYAYDNTIYVNTSEQVKEINIYNMLGQVITSVAGNGKSLNTIKVDKATAYYVVKVTTDKGVRTEKVFVK